VRQEAPLAAQLGRRWRRRRRCRRRRRPRDGQRRHVCVARRRRRPHWCCAARGVGCADRGVRRCAGCAGCWGVEGKGEGGGGGGGVQTHTNEETSAPRGRCAAHRCYALRLARRRRGGGARGRLLAARHARQRARGARATTRPLLLACSKGTTVAPRARKHPSSQRRLSTWHVVVTCHRTVVR
jgi:hypothetical protein